MSETVSLSGLGEEIVKRLQEFSTDVEEEVKKATDASAKKAVALLKEKSPKKTGAYASEWRSYKPKSVQHMYERNVYNRKKYQLTHLLEDGHGPGGKSKKSVRAIPHINPIRDQIAKEFEQAIVNAIEKYR